MNTKNSKRMLSAFMAVLLLLMTLPVSPLVNAAPVSVAEWVFDKDPDTTKTLTSFPATGGLAAAPTVTLSTYMGENSAGGAVGAYNATQKSFSVAGWDGGANIKYWKLALSTAGYENLQLSFNSYGSGTGPRDFKLQYSTDNHTFTDVENGAFTNTSAYNSVPTLSDLQLPAAVDDSAAVYLRFLQTSDLSIRSGTGTYSPTETVGAGGTSRLFNIYIKGEQKADSGVVAAVTATPDHGTQIALGSTVFLSTLTPDAAIEYTLNGGAVETINAASGQVVIDAFNQPGNLAVITAKAVKGATASVERTFTYTQAQVRPVSANVTGSISDGTQVKLTTPTEGAAITYILTRKAGESGEKADAKAAYTAPITLTADMLPARIEATAVMATYKDSNPATFNYTLKEIGAEEKVYFGQLHGHTTQSDGSGTLTDAYTYARDVAGLDFFAVTDHSNYFDTTSAPVEYENSFNNAKWQLGQQAAAAAATPDFVSFYGYEMTWTGGPGHINTFNTEGFVSRNNPKYASGVSGMTNFYKLLKDTPGAIGQFNHPGTTFGDFDAFSNYDPELNKHMTLIEVGNGEGAVTSGGYFRSYEYYNNALDKGWHLAPTNNQDNHKGSWGNSNTARTAIVTDDFSKEGVYAALRNLQVYATEDENLEIKYRANGELLGASLPAGIAELNISADLHDPDAGDQIGQVSVISSGGAETHIQNFTTNEANYSVKIDNPAKGYYYIRVVQGDGNIAVTAPVWVGEVEKVGITAVTSSASMPVTGEALNITAEIFNNEAAPATIESISYRIGGAAAEDKTLNSTLESFKTLKDSITYTPSAAGQATVEVTVHALVNGNSRTLTGLLQLNVRDAAKLVNIGVDASHKNEYVAGNYANSLTNFARLAEDYDIRLVEVKDGITPEKLAELQAFILTPPNRKASVGAFGEYTAEELAAVKAFADSGKTLIVTGLADYGDGKNASIYHAAYQQNLILDALNAKARLVDDELIDNTNYVSQNFRLRFKAYNMDSPYTFGVDPAQEYSFYSGSSITVADADKAAVTTIVASHATSESLDSDKDGLGGEGNPVVKGNIPVLTVETLDKGAKLFVAGSVFMSNFEVQATLDNAAELGYSNYNISQNILKEIAPRTITPIAEVQAAAEGTKFTVQGTVTSNASGYNQSTAFFDSIYVQDDTAGINLFPVSGNFKAGQKVEVTGTVGGYQGEKQLTVTDIQLLDASVKEIVPALVSTAEATADSSRGSLVKVEGIVKSVTLDSGKVGAIVLNDGSGDVRVFIDGYITPDVQLESIKAGERISAIGLSSVDTVGKRIRVRDRKEIKHLTGSIMKKIGSYSTGYSSKDGGVAEIVKYNSDNQKFYLVNGKEKQVDIVSLKGLKSGQDTQLTLDHRIDVSKMIEGFTFGDITSVDINTKLDIIAIAVQEADYSKAGAVLLLDYDGKYLKHYATGVQPDMITFTPDSKYVLTADEGEPREGYKAPATDPKGSVTVINLQTQSAKIVDFTGFDSTAARNALLADNVILKKQTAPSVDLEPEYAAVSADSKLAYISLQEANAIATLDIEKGIFTAVKGLGFKDHSLTGNELDMRRDGKIQIQTEANVLGMYNPDGITTYTAGGKTYILTANEGDSRDWKGHLNEKDVVLGKGQDGDSSKDMKVTAFDTSEYEVGAGGTGFNSGTMYLFGARSFSIWDAADMSLVYDSGAEFEQITAKLLPEYFNWSNDDYVFEKRSAKKGPEPEDVKVGVVDGKPYAFIGLERVGGNMMYDISNVSSPVYYDYLNTRDFANSVDNSGSKPAYKIAGDVSPEGQHFIPADQSPTRYPLLLVANEVSGTVSVVEIPKGYYTPPVDPTPVPTTAPTATPTPEPEATPTPTPVTGTPTATPAPTSAPTSASVSVPAVTPVPSATPSVQPTSSAQQITVTGTVAAAVLSLNAGTGEASFKLTDEAAAKLLANAAAGGTAGQRTAVEIRGGAVNDAKKVTVEFSSDFLNKLASGTQADLRINTGFAVITLGNQAADAISKAAKGETLRISVDRSSVSALGGSVQALVGNRPVYDFTITDGVSGITSFGGEAVKVQIPYNQAAGEDPNAIAVYYIDNSGNAISVLSRYNAATQIVEFQTSHFSKFAVSYLDSGFRDTADHWAKDSINFAAARGWFTGLGDRKFAPDQTLTRGMIATVLGKMSGADTSAASSFTDVQAQKYYAPYIAWAAANGIVQGTGNNRFAPDQAVSREELAVLMNNYLSYLKLQPGQQAATSSFADSEEISSWAAAAVANIQQSGLISGKPGNLFDPKGTATRAEVTAVLKKLNDSRFAQ
ncbi:choice-of-anchor I family protein [Paenibacillus sp. MMS20-IR301]|uniref:choice-of-anchor I family protein n=1 Tax=Paenibacillus sp. MMS20-IR301 TaxID=2895946 RepID=UPI0028E2FF74|nr:choice-of-anchor I family protein [Paenibacillus sp. MMS20-IR301]WNS46316.1 choice-of-anchor I family protein [Paenibacillus sp. MMS20-IR301]